MSVFFQITRNTFRECLREPVYFLILGSALLLIGTLPATTLFVFRRQLWMVLDSSMALTLLLGFVTAALCSSRCIRREMTNGTVLLLLSKPVPRFTYIAAKVIGIDLALAVFAVICGTSAMIAGLVAVNMFHFDKTGMLLYFLVFAACAVFGALRNYYGGRSFSANTVLALLVAVPVYGFLYYGFISRNIGDLEDVTNASMFISFSDLFPALMLTLLALILIGSIAASFATHFSFMANLLFCLALFLAGVTASPWMKATFGADSLLTAIGSAVIPNWQHFWMSSALSSGAHIPGSYLMMTAAYVLIYSLIWVFWAAAAFQNTELAKDSRV